MPAPSRLGPRHPGPRLGYTKSRTGCTRCKTRRVKCDETKPACKACVRHRVVCSFMEPGATEASGSTAGASSTRSGSGPGLGAIPLHVAGSGNTSSNLAAPFAPGPSSGPGFHPLPTFAPTTGSASNPIASTGVAPASGFGPVSGSGSGSGSGFGAVPGFGQTLPVMIGAAPTSGPGSGPIVSGSGPSFLPVRGTAVASASLSFPLQPGNASNPFSPAPSAHATSPAGAQSGIHTTNPNSHNNSSVSASHDAINFNTPPTANRHTPMAIESLTNPPYPTPSSPLRPSPMSTEPSNTPAPDPFRNLTQALANSSFQIPSCSSNSDLAPQLPNLEILYHYTTTTYKSLTRGVHKDIWKIEMPKLAFSHPFLMHNLMSTAAFHLACTEQDEEKRQKWGIEGNRHFTLALEGMTEILRKEGVTPENCHAVFASSSLSYIGALCGKGPLFGPAYNRELGKIQASMMDELLGVFILVRGIGSIVAAQEDILRKGPVGGLFSAEPSGEDHPSMDRLVHQLKGFYKRVASITSRRPGFFASPPNLDDTPQPTSNLPMEHQIILREITAMADSIKFATSKRGIPEQEIMTVWPLTMSSEFVDLLQKKKVPQQQHEPPQPSTSATSSSFTSPPPGGRNPIALALMGYYCCVMKGTETECWFTKGWAEALSKEVISELEEMAEVPQGHHAEDHTGVDKPLEVWREWVRKEWLEDAQWARKWITTKAEEELPKPTLSSGDPMADATKLVAEGQQPAAVAPVIETRDQRPDVPEPAPTTTTSSEVSRAEAEGPQPDVPGAQAATEASEENVDTTSTAEKPTRATAMRAHSA